MKKVYFAAAIRGDISSKYTVVTLIDFIKEELKIEVLSEHVGAENPIKELSKKIGKTVEELNSEDIEKQDIRWIDESTHLIAEISGASTGTGREIEYARTKENFGKIPAKILCIYHKDREYYASPMIRGMTKEKYPNVFISNYSNLEEAKEIIKEFLKS